MKSTKKAMSLLLFIAIAVSAAFGATAFAAPPAPSVDAPSVCLIEKETGTIIFEHNAHEKLAPASVTKVMTMLLCMEALDSGQISRDDMVSISAHAMSMGGSQVFLAEGEQYSVDDLMKGMIIASGNDASVALAEHISGSETAFVALMNQRAAELGMTNTHFVNCCGLDADGHETTSYDIALMSASLVRNHPTVRDYTTIWQDSLRDGTFGLDNTNKLVRFYAGATGLKTGSTGKAKCCIAASAERDGIEFVAVVMAAHNSDTRFRTAKELLDYGFAHYTLKDTTSDVKLTPVTVLKGLQDTVDTQVVGNQRILVEKVNAGKIEVNADIVSDVEAPVVEGQKLGVITLTLDGEIIATHDVVAVESVERKTWTHFFNDLLERVTMR